MNAGAEIHGNGPSSITREQLERDVANSRGQLELGLHIFASRADWNREMRSNRQTQPTLPEAPPVAYVSGMRASESRRHRGDRPTTKTKAKTKTRTKGRTQTTTNTHRSATSRSALPHEGRLEYWTHVPAPLESLVVLLGVMIIGLLSAVITPMPTPSNPLPVIARQLPPGAMGPIDLGARQIDSSP